jgi:hypothetical protein
MNAKTLRDRIERSLKAQGFHLTSGRISLPANMDKEKLRKVHELAVKHRIEQCKHGLLRHEERLMGYIAKGTEVNPESVSPVLVEVGRDSEEELLFRYASLHWSIPISSGYGRRIRFLVFDESNNKLIGLFGFRDPVYGLAARDNWIGWNEKARRNRLQHVMDAFVLGAVPPYSALLCGKLVAMLLTSTEVRAAFKRKYQNRRSCIRRRLLDGRLALVTTTSALGRSSIYNRLRFRNRLLYQSVGFTQGSGEIHFSNGEYDSIFDYATRYCDPTAKHSRWGRGFRNRREVVRICLGKIGLSQNWTYHGIKREVFVIPLAKNCQEFLRGEHSKLFWLDHSANELFRWFRDRWLLPRAKRDPRFLEFDPNTFRLWKKE